eukprot:gene11926-8511_t
MSQPTYFEFVAEPAPTIKALQQVTNESLGQAQPEMDNCVREYFRWRLPELLRNYEVQKTIDPRINVKRGYKIGAPIEGMSQTFFISTYLRSFVRIPLTAIKDPVRCDPILNELIGCFDEQSMVDDLQNVVSQLQTLPDAYDHIDAAPYLFADFSTLASLQSLRTTPGPREPSAEALSYGYFQSSYHNLMAEGGLPSPAEMLIERLRAVSTWGVKLRSQFYANFACLVQGSGSGKSRLAKECSAHFYVVYLCLRPASSSGSPPRSALATLFLHIAEEAAVTQEAHRLLIDRFFAAIFYVIATQVDWEAHSTDGRVSPSTFWEYTMVEQAASFSQKVARTFREWQTHPTLQHESVATLMEQALTVLDPQSAISGSTFLVVLDEARELLCSCRNVPNTPSLFLQWRSWLSFSGTWSSSFFLLLDTTSRVTNFFPSKPTEDPSARIAQHGVKLLRPIFEFPFLGPWPLPSELQTGVYQTFSGLLRVQDWVSALAGLPLSAAFELFEEGAAPGSPSDRLTCVLASAVSFTGWTVAQEPITDRMLQYAWCHRVGYLCNDEEPAMDLILPLVRCPSATMAPMTTEQTHAVANATPSTDATVGKKRALDEEDAATEARTVKRLTRETRSTIRGSPPPTANVVPAVPTARRMPSRRDENKDDMDEGEGEQPAKEPSSRGDCGTFVGLVVNGFDERLVGVDAKAQLEALSAQVSNTGIALDMYRQEHMDAALAQRYALVCQQQGARLPGHFDEAADAQPAVAADPRQTGNSKNTGGKKTKAVAAVTAPTTSAAPSTTTNPSEQPLTWTHRLVSVTSETVKRTLRVYSLGSVAR